MPNPRSKVTIALPLVHLRIVAAMIPQAHLLRTEVMEAAVEFLSEVRRCMAEGDDDESANH
jgi:hypothetical protein